MKIQALIKVINPVVTGTSQSTGNPYQKQDIVLGWEEQREDGRLRQQLLKVTLHGQSVDRLAQMRPTAGVTVVEGDLVFGTSTYNGKVYNDVTLFI